MDTLNLRKTPGFWKALILIAFSCAPLSLLWELYSWAVFGRAPTVSDFLYFFVFAGLGFYFKWVLVYGLLTQASLEPEGIRFKPFWSRRPKLITFPDARVKVLRFSIFGARAVGFSRRDKRFAMRWGLIVPESVAKEVERRIAGTSATLKC